MLSPSNLMKMRNEKKHPPPPLPESLSFADRTVLVTGASSGIGPVAAELFARHKASRLILGVRNVSAGEAAAASIREKHPNAETSVMQVDMSSYSSIASFAKKLKTEVPRLDVAVLNAGALKASHKIVEGWEETLMVNCNGTLLLAVLLLPILKAAKAALRETFGAENGRSQSGASWPHLVIVSSSGHRFVTEKDCAGPPENWGLQSSWGNTAGFDGQKQYARSKLALEWCVPRLVDLATGQGGKNDPDCIVTTVCPGPTYSQLGRDMAGGGAVSNWMLQGFAAIFMRTTEEGTRNLIAAATLGPEEMGVWWVDGKVTERGPLATNEMGLALGKRAWEEMVGDWRAKKVEGVEEALGNA